MTGSVKGGRLLGTGEASSGSRLWDVLAHVGVRASCLPRLEESVFDYRCVPQEIAILAWTRGGR